LFECGHGSDCAEIAAEDETTKGRGALCAEDGGHLQGRLAPHLLAGQIPVDPDPDQGVDEDRSIDDAHTASSVRSSVGAYDLRGRGWSKAFWALRPQATLGLGDEFCRGPQGGVALEFGQQVLLDAHARSRGAGLVDAVDVLWDVADLDGCDSAIVAL
jgi:hypothetical protein